MTAVVEETAQETTSATDTAPVSETGEAGTAPEAEAPETGDGHSKGPGREAAKYRTQRNEAREERDQLAARLEALQTAELHRAAGELLAQPEDISLSGQSLKDFLTPEGWLDHEAVAEAAQAVIEGRPGLAKNPRVLATDSTQGQGGQPGKAQPNWESLFESAR